MYLIDLSLLKELNNFRREKGKSLFYPDHEIYHIHSMIETFCPATLYRYSHASEMRCISTSRHTYQENLELL